jgi:hypothetical protein
MIQHIALRILLNRIRFEETSSGKQAATFFSNLLSFGRACTQTANKHPLLVVHITIVSHGLKMLSREDNSKHTFMFESDDRLDRAVLVRQLPKKRTRIVARGEIRISSLLITYAGFEWIELFSDLSLYATGLNERSLSLCSWQGMAALLNRR